MPIDNVAIHHVKFPLVTPYKVSLLTMTMFDPFIVEIGDSDGRVGWGEVLIVPGYTTESVEGAWALCVALAESIIGLEPEEAQALVARQLSVSIGAASAMLAALDMLRGHPVLSLTEAAEVPLLAPLHASERPGIVDEVERRLAEGYRTLKVKAGFEWRSDLRRVQWIQEAVAGRATLRLDANQGFNESDGKAFASALDPSHIELFEQPCHADDWMANAAVAAVSTVPVMLDESIYGVADIDRAAKIPGVDFVKLKLKKIGSIDMLIEALNRIRALNMTPVLGDGVSMEIGCWMEACVAVHGIANAGEMNGFLKVGARLFQDPLECANGSIRMPAGYSPVVDRGNLERHTLRTVRFGAAR
jgi:L-alanine-DL-glutamate epimerase-like enolase superfamily enzyme